MEFNLSCAQFTRLVVWDCHHVCSILALKVQHFSLKPCSYFLFVKWDLKLLMWAATYLLLLLVDHWHQLTSCAIAMRWTTSSLEVFYHYHKPRDTFSACGQLKCSWCQQNTRSGRFQISVSGKARREHDWSADPGTQDCFPNFEEALAFVSCGLLRSADHYIRGNGPYDGG